eukprot:123644-Pelagomonas_calceolata.AAC.4
MKNGLRKQASLSPGSIPEFDTHLFSAGSGERQCTAARSNFFGPQQLAATVVARAGFGWYAPANMSHWAARACMTTFFLVSSCVQGMQREGRGSLP